MSVKQNLFVSVFVHECLMMLNDVEYTTFKMFITQMSNYLFVIAFQLMFYKHCVIVLSLVSIYSKLHDHDTKTKRLCDWSVILPTNRFVLAQNWSLSWSNLALWKPGLSLVSIEPISTRTTTNFEPKQSD